jgi:flagellar motility protein MotE (MotC chaperone)
LLPTLGLSFTLKSELKTQKLRWKSLSEIKTQWQAKQKDHSKLRNDLEKLNQELQTLQTQLHDKDEFLVN